MSKNILNNQESFTRTKKRLKKLLQDKGLNLSLCETSDLLAKALGFKNTFDINKNYFENIEQEQKVIDMMEKPEGCKIFSGKTIDGMSNKQIPDTTGECSTSPWKKGAVTFLTPSGKVMPYQPYSPAEPVWVTGFWNGDEFVFLKEEK